MADLWNNPAGPDGFEFVEYTGPDPTALGFVAAVRHRSKNVTLYKQGGVNFIVNAEPESFAQAFARLHGPSVCAIAPDPARRARGAKPLRRRHASAQIRPAAVTSSSSAASGRAPTWLMISAAHRLPIAPQVGSGQPRVRPYRKPAA